MNYYLHQRPRRKKSPGWSIAAAVLLLAGLSAGAYLFWFASGKEAPRETATVRKAASESIRHPVIGVTAPLSGPLKREGESFKEGAELAWKELQNQGIEGEMVFREGGREDAEALEAARKLLADPRLTVLMAHLPMTVLSRVIADCESRKVILAAPAGSHERLAGSPWVIPFIASDRNEGAQAAGIAGELAGGTKVAFLYEPGPYGELLLQGFQEGGVHNAPEHQTILCRTDDPSLRDTLSEKLSPETALIFLAGSPLWGIAVADVLSELNFQGRLLLPRSFGKMPLDDLADKFAGRLYVLKPLAAEAEGNASLENLQKTFVRMYWKKPDEPAILAYDAMKWVGNVLMKGAVTREELRDRLRAGAHAEAPYRGAGGEVFFDGEGRLQRRMHLTQYLNGKFIPVTASK